MRSASNLRTDPALAGVQFGPQMYAVDSTGGTALYTSSLHTPGSGNG